jgi:hypothetical protein
VLAIDVQGNPSEMLLSGNIADADKDQWILYQTKKTVTWTSSEGEKTLRIKFRDSFGRESAWAEAVETLRTAGSAPVVSVTNRIRPGGTGWWEVTLTAPSRLAARVLTSTGEDVCALLDGERGAGVWPVQWDGTNASGRRVAPGVYFLEIKINGQATRERILVSPF